MVLVASDAAEHLHLQLQLQLQCSGIVRGSIIHGWSLVSSSIITPLLKFRNKGEEREQHEQESRANRKSLHRNQEESSKQKTRCRDI